ncbi:MAG: hypothetical protein GY926_05300 [bacterium]|nr:hypothetical protein [bacterium]MCP4964630.1 hypothetical protein [bacterium]
MEFDQPDEDAYGRVTNPERYQVVAEAATALVGSLVDAFDVVQSSGDSAVDFPNWRDAPPKTIRLVPNAGAPLAFAITDFPVVGVRFGEWGKETFPSCGCDACDEQPSDVMRRMNDLVEAAVDGRYEEELTKRMFRISFTGSWGRQSSERRLKRREWRDYGQPGLHKWPRWPRR